MFYLNFLKDKYNVLVYMRYTQRWKSLPYTRWSSNHPPKKTPT